jgi:predicted CXXCH cytochrome family protein
VEGVRVDVRMLVFTMLVGAACAARHAEPTPPARPVLGVGAHPSASPSRVGAGYVGSASCAPCHEALYARWRRTRMANVLVDPREHPEAILPDLDRPDPLVTFSRDDVTYVYGSKWKQRYFKRVGNDLYPLPAQWDVTHKTWKRYFVEGGTDWWVPFYPADNMKRPTGPLCDGCHSVYYDVATHAVSEWNVGCEKCHGPGEEHVRAPARANIVNPARLDPFHEDDVCIQCHSQGRPPGGLIDGRAYDWPVGFRVGLELKDFWRLEEHRLGATSFTHYADGTAHKNRMQGNDFAESLMYARGVTCSTCHDVHGTGEDADLVAPPRELCARCHQPGGRNGPRATTIERHTHHAAGSPGSECIACHMPKIEQTIGDVNVRAHTFRFIPPAATEKLGVPNPCTLCHADRSPGWAAEALRSWSDLSPWRVAP